MSLRADVALRASNLVSTDGLTPDRGTRGCHSDRGRRRFRIASRLVLILLVVGPMIAPRWALAGSATPPDIYFIWRDGARLAHGGNLYEHVPDEPVSKQASYLPLFFLFVAATTRWLDVPDFESWMQVWRPILIGVHLAIAGLIAMVAWRRAHPTIALLGAVFWGLNRWSLYVVRVGQIDELALLLLILSLWLFTTRRRTSLVLFGMSLAIKHVAIGAWPLYLVWTWQTSRGRTRRARMAVVLTAAGWIALIPVLVSLPFLWWNPGAFVQSLLFSATRDAGGHLNAAGAGSLAGLHGVLARLPMLLVTAGIAVAAARREIDRHLSVLLILAAFTDFNAVIFVQYLAWTVPFLVLAACESSEDLARPSPGITSAVMAEGVRGHKRSVADSDPRPPEAASAEEPIAHTGTEPDLLLEGRQR